MTKSKRKSDLFTSTSKSEMTLIGHLTELRRRLLFVLLFFALSFTIAYYFSEALFAFLVRPLARIFQEQGTTRRLIYTGLAEAFLTYLKVSLFTASFLSLPMGLLQLWFFIAPGLYQTERKVFLPFLIASPLLFFLGAVFAYGVIMPLAWEFFVYFETPTGGGGLSDGSPSYVGLPIQLEARVSEYLSLTMQLILVFGLCFQLPIVLVLLGWAGIVTAQVLEKNRKYAFLGILILSALLTPPDLLSMIGLAIPLYLLYELSIIFVKLLQKKKKPGA